MFYSRLLKNTFSLAARLRVPKFKRIDYSQFLKLGAISTGLVAYSFSTVMCNDDPVREIEACNAADIPEGSMRKIQIGENEDNFILVSKVCGKIYATGGKCSHYGAPLQMGFLDGYSVICPWHAAAFDVRTGEIFHAPGLDSIPTYKVTESNGKVIVHIPESKINSVSGSFRSKKMVKRDPNDNRVFVVVGGGAAGSTGVETLRKEGYTGRIIFVTNEKLLPYDRVVISKNFKVKAEELVFRSQEFYQEFDIEIQTGAEVVGIDTDHKVLKLKNGKELHYDKALLATGCSARVPGPFKKYTSNFSNVFTLRSAADHDKIRQSIANANKITIIGAGFLGLEAAKNIRTTWPEKEVTIIDLDQKPLANILGEEISEQILATQKMNGVHLITGQQIGSFEGKDGAITGINLPTHASYGVSENNTLVATDYVIFATGAQINTSYIPGNLTNLDGSIRVNSHFQSEDPYIYAAGDIAQFPSLLSESRERVEHWAVAEQQGRIAALNMLGKGNNYLDVPFFWSNQFLNVSFAGFSSGHDSTFTESRGEDDPGKTARITYFFKGERCIGVSSVNWPGSVLRLKIALHRGLMPSKKEIINGSVRFNNIIERVKNSNPCGTNCCRN